MTLEEILNTYFKCKQPFLAETTRADRQYFSKPGAVAYDKLVALLEDLAELTAVDTDELIGALESIATGEI